jgi:hypothetical protein
MKTVYLLLLAFVCLAFVASDTKKTLLHFQPYGNDKYLVPEYPTNTLSNVTYACLIVKASRFQQNGAEWGITFEDLSDGEYAHHYTVYVLPSYIPGLQPGGTFHGAVESEVIGDCAVIGGGSSMIFSGQPGVPPLDLLASFDVDNSTSNGYPYGIPIGVQTDCEWIAFQAHIHNDEHIPNLEIKLKYHITTTTDAPRESLVLS